MSLFSAQLHPGRALGFLVLGASLHDILTRLKAEPQRFPKLELLYTRADPVREPVVLALPANGIRMRFDGPEQRLRLIEVVDFTKNHIFLKPANDKERDLVRPPTTAQPSSPQQLESPSGPTFRHIYQRFLGPTYDGEYIPDEDGANQESGTYVLSYPGVAFIFPMKRSDYSPAKDVVSLLSSSAVPTAMAVFSGDSWAQSREILWTEVLPSVKAFTPLAKGKDICPDEVSLIKIYGGGKLQMFRKWTNSSFWVMLGDTTPQQLVAELGPPDAIYRKNDQRMYIHKLRAASNTMARPNGNDLKRQDDLTDTDQYTDQSSTHTASDGYDSNDEAVEDDILANVSGECFYNYFYLGFDILVSTPTTPSHPPPSQQDGNTSQLIPESAFKAESPDRLVATKVILHGNVPGSYPFNRHRRCRWEIPYLTSDSSTGIVINSETPFPDLEDSLREEWKSIYASETEARQKQRGMVLNRGWGDSPGSSCELLGGWEETGGAMTPGVGRKFDGSEDSTTTLYGFPGLVFEVLKNGYVSALTVF
ncbi:hypothetical protein B0H66DRAFT_13915 [Apodospora peruviana]|uniref:Uncharacterized protein n=1 Tax=Apodospora peruviana TaxID=516989 RepID=A0AAE0IQB9_9PEZI|nr:hypothetical protein B0H66DRAFT_13915 [Apodospora peruviana]